MTEEFRVITHHLVNLSVTSSSHSFASMRRFQKDLTIVGLKDKLELLTGASAGSMKLLLYNKDNVLICPIDNDSALLGSYPVDDDMRIHVEDNSQVLGEFEDVSRVEKYEMKDDDYSKRADSVRSFKERNKFGRFNAERVAQLEGEKLEREKEEKLKLEGMKVGDRCEVLIPGNPTRRGMLKYIGETDFKPGQVWVGVQYDEPHGKNDGSVEGKRYFECLPKYGGFVKAANIEVGDFPEDVMNFSDEEM